MATDGTTSTATKAASNSKQKQKQRHRHRHRQQPLAQSQWQPIQSINSALVVHYNQQQLQQTSNNTIKHKPQEWREEEWLGQWSHIWANRQTPEWKPRRASVATCQQQQYLIQQHQEHRMRSYDNNQSTLDYYQQQQHQQQHTLTDPSLRKYILQRLQCPLKARHANGKTVVTSCGVDDNLQQESNELQISNAQVEVNKRDHQHPHQHPHQHQQQQQQNQLKKVINFKSDQVPQCQDQANSDSAESANCGQTVLEESRSLMAQQQQQQQQQQSKDEKGIIGCRQATFLSDGQHLIETGGQETDLIGGLRALNLETSFTSSPGITDCCYSEGIGVAVSPNHEMLEGKRERRRTRVRLRRGVTTETGGNNNSNSSNNNTTDTNSGSDTDIHSNSNSNLNSCSSEPDIDTEAEKEVEGEEAADRRLLQFPTGSSNKQEDELKDSKLKVNRSRLEQLQQPPQKEHQQENSSYFLHELPDGKSTLATCCFQTTPSLASRSTNEPCKVTGKPTNHSMIQELELHDKQRKSLIFSMALKKLISESKLVSEFHNCRCGRKNSESNNSGGSVIPSSSSTNTTSSRSRRTGNNKVNLSRVVPASTCEESFQENRKTTKRQQHQQQRSVSSSVLFGQERLLVSSAGDLESLVSCSNQAESEQARSVVEQERNRRSSEDTYIRIGFNPNNNNNNNTSFKEQLTICARCYNRGKSVNDNFEAEKSTTLKQHTANKIMTRNMMSDSSTAANNNNNHSLNINDQQQDNSNQQRQQEQNNLVLSQSNGSCCVSSRKSTTSFELINEDDDCDLESLIVESWLDDHPNFVHDYFMRKASNQLIDDWLITHAKVSNTSLKSSQLDLMVNLRSSESRLSQSSLNNISNNNQCGLQNTTTINFLRSESESPTSGAQMLMSGLIKPANSPSFLTSTRSESQHSGAATPVRKISATDFESKTGNNFLRPMVSTTPDGKPTFLSQLTLNDDNEELTEIAAKQNLENEVSTFNMQENGSSSSSSGSREEPQSGNVKAEKSGSKVTANSDSEDDNEVTRNDEVKLIFELVKNICNDLEIKTLLHKILKNIAVLINADKSSLFLVCGKTGDPNRHLVSQLFNVDQDDLELVSSSGNNNNNNNNNEQCESSSLNKNNECIRIPWGTGLVGYVAESGESLNIENCYDDPRFTNTVDKRTGYVTKHMLCAPIFDKRNEIVGVAQVINKRDGKSFSKSDEIKFKRYLQFCGIGLRNAQSYEQSQLENKRNQVLLDLARMVFEEQSTIEQVVYRIMLHTQSLLECQRCQVLLIDDGSDDLDQLLQLPTTGASSRASTWSWLGSQAKQQTQLQPTSVVGDQQSGYNQNITFQQNQQTTYQLQSQQTPQAIETPEWRPHCGQAADLTTPTSVNSRKIEQNDSNSSHSRSSTSTSASKAQMSSLESKYLEGKESEMITQPQDSVKLSSANNVGIRQRPNETPRNTNTSNSPPTKLFSLVFDLECDGNDLVMHSNKSEKSTMTTTTTITTNSSNTSTSSNSSSSTNTTINTTITTNNLNNTANSDMTTTTNTDSKKSSSSSSGQFPINFGITGYVAMTGETLNIENAHEHERFDPSVDENSNFKHKSILCMPIRNGQRKIIGVSQLINKKNGRPFNKNDEDLFEAFAIFCGLGIHNTLMYEKVLKIMAKQRVTFEVLSYHATASLEEAKKLNLEQIPSCFALNLTSFQFNDFSLDEQFMLKSCLRFFLDLDLMRRFQIDQLVFCNWILSVQKNYRKVTYHPIVGGTGLKAAPVRYHNWRHAFNVSQMMFAILINTQICQALGELETLALLIACLCHDLDHRGTNNSFQIKSASPLAELYSTSTMEHHHFDQCVMILNSQGNQILANLSPQEYSRVIVLLEEAILATDLANYFQKREIFFQLVNSDTFDWHNNLEHRSLLRCMLMTACDVAAITKPWSVQKVVADLVMSEFYQQGDIEKQELNIEPIDMMNRDKMSKLPEMQIGFIDSICAPIYAAFAKLFPHQLGVLLEGCLTNRDLWTEVAKNNNNTIIDLPNTTTTTTNIDSTSTTTSKNNLNLAQESTNIPLVNQAKQNHSNEQQTMQSSAREKGRLSLCTIVLDDQSNVNQEYPLSGLINRQSQHHYQHCNKSTNVDCQRKSV